MKRKSFMELELRDAFMFATVMMDPEICRLMLERILGFSIREVTVDTEHAFTVNPDYRGVRLDARADDADGTAFTIEMQVSDQHNLPKRSRCYQSQMDVESLKPGAEFEELPESYVIFICLFDPFGRGRYRYTYREECAEDGELLGDGTCKIFLNTKGRNPEEVPKALVDFLHYVEDASVPEVSGDDFLRYLRQKIMQIKKDRKMEGRYMTFGELLDDERREGRAEGRIEGQNMFLALIRAMTADGRTAEISRLAEDVTFRDEMFAQYHVTDGTCGFRNA
ncbi:MAG: Rpn family recombination-promoting nuclease/putative transposase [Clostridiales bacterium]|nr:Rpn family recombination-promoting nuclease/putative transposase [Clostridiales bacterium]